MIGEIIIIIVLILFFEGVRRLNNKHRVKTDGKFYFYEYIHTRLIEKYIQPRLIEKKLGISKYYTINVIVMWCLILWVAGFFISCCVGVADQYVKDIRWILGAISFGLAFWFIRYVSKSLKYSIDNLKNLAPDESEVRNDESEEETTKDQEDIKVTIKVDEIINNKGWFFVVWAALSLIPLVEFFSWENGIVFHQIIYGSTLLSVWALIMWICSCFFTATFAYFNIKFVQKCIWKLPEVPCKLKYSPAQVFEIFSPFFRISFAIALMWTIAMFYVFFIFSYTTPVLLEGVDAIERIIFIVGVSLSLMALITSFWKIPEAIKKVKNNEIKKYSEKYEKEISLCLEPENNFNENKFEACRNHLIDVQSIPEIPHGFSNISPAIVSLLINIIVIYFKIL